MIDIVIPSHNRPEELASHTLQIVPEAHVLVHRDEDADLYEPHLPDSTNLWVMNTEPGGCGKSLKMREYMRSKSEGEWVLFMDDDVKNIYRLKEPWCSNEECPVWDIRDSDERKWARDQFQSLEMRIEDGSLWKLIEEMIEESERQGATLAGARLGMNILYRRCTQVDGQIVSHEGCRWRSTSFLAGVFMLVRKTEMTIPMSHVEDWHMTLKHMWRDGKVLSNGHTFVNVRSFSNRHEGGFGRREERLAAQERDFLWLEKKFEGVIRCYTRKNGYLNIAFKPYTARNIQRFRETHPFENYDLPYYDVHAES